jgi:protein NrfC
MSSEQQKSGLDRRAFLKGLGAAGIVATAGGAFFLKGSNLMVIPNSKGFLVVDMGKCMGCGSCMITCSLAHHGIASMSLARIQIQQDSWANWPDDIFMAVCHQCEDAPCVKACPVGADHVDREHGNVRTIDPARCIGCMQCIAACPWLPKRLQWNPQENMAQKCDLCADTPYLKEKGGPGGTQSCVKVCPAHAIAFVEKMPNQKSKTSYNVNLRGKGWKALGATTDDIVREG